MKPAVDISLPRILVKGIHCLVAGWTVFCFGNLLIGMIAISGRAGLPDGSGPGASFGTTLGIGFWMALWVIPAALGELVGLSLSASARQVPTNPLVNRREWLIAGLLAAIPILLLLGSVAVSLLTTLTYSGRPPH